MLGASIVIQTVEVILDPDSKDVATLCQLRY